MYDNNSKGIPYTAGFFILVAFAVAGLIFASLLSPYLWHAFTGLGYKELQANLVNPDPGYANIMKVMQAIIALVGFFIPAVVTAAVLNRKPMRLLGFSSRIKAEQAGLVVLIIGVSLIVSTSFSWFNYHIPIPDTWKIRFNQWENDYNKQVEAIVSLKTGGDYVFSLVIMAFLPALCEETLFRGGLQNFLGRGTKQPWLAIVVVSILFSLAHASFYGFLSRFFLGMILGALFYYSGKLWLSILAHFLNNALALTVLFVYTQKGRPLQDVMKNETSTPWGIILLGVIIALFIVFKRVSVPNRRID
jgi:membrane protease YdiL (CAAX protease family)